MKIKKKTDIFIETCRQFVISEPESNVQTACLHCRETMLTAEQAAAVFGTSRRFIYQLVETDVVHFVETETGVMMICLSSLAAVLDDKARENHISMSNKAANAD